MDEGSLLALLRKLDDPFRSESVAGWDRSRAEEDFRVLASAIEERLGVPLMYETGAAIQDASFHGTILLPRELLTEDYLASIRVSNFDSLATIYDDDTVVQPDAYHAILTTLKEHGYTYIPSAVLNTPYDGGNPGVGGFRTWGERYFDWT